MDIHKSVMVDEGGWGLSVIPLTFNKGNVSEVVVNLGMTEEEWQSPWES